MKHQFSEIALYFTQMMTNSHFFYSNSNNHSKSQQISTANPSQLQKLSDNLAPPLLLAHYLHPFSSTQASRAHNIPCPPSSCVTNKASLSHFSPSHQRLPPPQDFWITDHKKSFTPNSHFPTAGLQSRVAGVRRNSLSAALPWPSAGAPFGEGTPIESRSSSLSGQKGLTLPGHVVSSGRFQLRARSRQGCCSRSSGHSSPRAQK